MSLLFTENSTNRVALGTALGGWTAGSWVFWYYPISLAGTLRNIIQFYTGAFPVPALASGGTSSDELRMTWRRSSGGSNMIYETNNANITVNKWWYVGATVDQGLGAGVKAKFYLGDLSTLATLRTNGTTTDPAGFTSNTGSTMYVGDNNIDSTSNGMQIACLQFFPGAVLTEAEIQRHQFQFVKHLSSCRLHMHFGFNGTGTQADWSGFGNSGTVTGATVAAHVPFRPWFGADDYLDLKVVTAAAVQRQRFLQLNQSVKRASYW